MMKKRLLALLMAAVMTISLLPTTAWAHDAAHAEGIRDTEGVEDVQGSEGDRDLEEVSDSENVPGEDAVDAAALAAVEDDGPAALAAATTLDSYFEGLPVIAETEPGSPSSTKKWKVTTLGGDTVLMSGNKGKSSSTSTLQLTFTGDTHLTFEYKVSSEKNCDKCTITLGSDKLVNGESGDQNWKPLELDAKSGQVLTVVYTKDSSSDRFDDCVYLRNFSAGEALVVTFHANNGTEDTAQQKVYGGKAALKANTFTCENKIFAGWAAAADGEVLYQDGERITTETSLDLYAVWADAYTVTFDNDGATATVMTPRNGAIGSRIPADPSREGYTFDGWFNGETKLTAETVISGDSTYTAKWTAITYTIAFSGGSESTGSVESIPAAYDREVTLPRNAFTRPGYSFNGWSQSSSASKGSYAEGDAVKNLTSTQGTTVTLYAAWQPLPVTVRLHLNYAGAEDITRTGAVGSNYNYTLTDAGTTRFNSITDPKRDGYIFDGWYDAAEGGSAIGTTYKFTAADAEDGFDMYAHWVKGIIVHFDGNGYSDEWKAEAARRGLDCETSTPLIFDRYLTADSIRMFESTGVLNKVEIEARTEVKWETYTKKIQIEGRVLGDLTMNHIVPIASRYEAMLLDKVYKMAQIGGLDASADIDLLKKIQGHTAAIQTLTIEMIEARKKANRIENARAKAIAYHDTVEVYFEEIRRHIDKLEEIIDDQMWTLPKYRELLFIK